MKYKHSPYPGIITPQDVVFSEHTKVRMAMEFLNLEVNVRNTYLHRLGKSKTSEIGLSVLILALVYERSQSPEHVVAADAHCPHCVRAIDDEALPRNVAAWINTLGGLFLAGGHIRNYRLCRRSACNH